MKSFNSNNIIPFIIICFCLLIFIGILRIKKAEKINNIMENFIINEKFNNKNIEKFNNKNINVNHTLDKNFISEYMNGLWTTPGTILDKEEFATQLMEINLIDKKGFIQLPKVTGNTYFDGLKYNIILSNGMSIVATSSESPYTLSINTVDISKNKNYGKDGLLLTTNVPLAKVIFIDKNNNILSNIYSYKIPENRKIEKGQLKDIIESKNFNGYEIKDKYDIPSYIKIIGDYRFINNPISFNFGINTNSSTEITNYYNIIKNNYGGKLSFRIAREFTTTKGSTIKTQASEIYVLEAIKNIGNNKNIFQIPQTINIIEPIKDVKLNKINYKEYIPKSTIIYFYKTTNTSINYSFTNSTKINNLKFNFDNNGSTMFSTNNVDINDLNSLTKNITSENKIMVFKVLFTPNINNKISISFSDLYNLL
jgi:hypothetical protein